MSSTRKPGAAWWCGVVDAGEDAGGDSIRHPFDLCIPRRFYMLTKNVKLRSEMLEEDGQVVQLAVVKGTIGDERLKPEGVHLSIDQEIDVTKRTSAGVVVGVEPPEELLHPLTADLFVLLVAAQLSGLPLQAEHGAVEGAPELAHFRLRGVTQLLQLELTHFMRHGGAKVGKKEALRGAQWWLENCGA